MQENTRIRQETGAAETLRTHMKPGVAEMHQKVVRLVRSRNCGNAKKRNQTASGFARCALRKCTFTLRFRYKTAVGNSKFHPVQACCESGPRGWSDNSIYGQICPIKPVI